MGMTNINSRPLIRQSILWILCILILSLDGCKQEVLPEVTDVDIVFEPLGEQEKVLSCKPGQGDINYLLTDFQRIIKTRGTNQDVEWSMNMPLFTRSIVPCKDESVIAITSSVYGYDLMYFSRIGKDGNMVYAFTADKLFDDYPNHYEHFINACSDGNNGAYALVALRENGKWPDQMRKDDVFLLHIDAQNNFTKIKLNDYYLRIASDQQGNLYGLRYEEWYFYVQASEEPDSFYIEEFDMSQLNKGIIAKTWSSGFTVGEYYANYYFEHNFNLSVNSRYVYYAAPLARLVDVIYGHKMVALDRSNGKQVHHKTILSPTYVDIYVSGASLSGFADENGYYSHFSIGATTRLLQMDLSGNLVKNIDIKGTNNRSEIHALASYQSDLWIWGIMSKGKNAQMVPFFQKMRIQ